ncbi:hypothetical protein FKO01_19795 [Mesorhizobium sp. B2-3-3]|nr:hypothetical protein FKO01_19795 [Mesorhizobium sp. B2-3-3]
MTARTATTKPADDQPFDFNLDAVKAEAELTPWRVNWSGRRWEFAHMDNFDMWPFINESASAGIDEMAMILRTALGDEQWAEFQKLPIKRYKMKALFDGYQKYCGVETGESEASSDS